MARYAEKPAGSPAAGEPAFLAVGKVRRPHGVAGDVLVEIYTDFPERLRPMTMVYAGENHYPLTICRQRFHNDGLLLAFDGFITPEEVGRFRNQILYVATAAALELPEGEYYFHELLGISVTDDTGKALGEVTEIMQTGANDVYVVTNGVGREILLPVIAGVILSVDMVSRSMKVHLLPGLVDDGDLQS
ncbi:MAG: ribosome maturation factor RimM [Anaerolineales bacterium]|jgi:16S rRNA processing protein RimM